MGILVTLDGVNGGGKTEVIQRLIEKLRQHYPEYSIYKFRCPGDGIPKIRDIFKDPDAQFSGLTDLFLSAADQYELFVKKVLPILKNDGSIVIIDRLFDSMYAYQTVYGHLSNDIISIITMLSISGRRPDLTLILDIPYEESLKRVKQQGKVDRFEKDFTETFEKLRSAYLSRKESDPSRISIIDATKDFDEVVDECYLKIINLIIGHR